MTEIPKSVRAYYGRCNAILSWLSKGWISHDEFDKHSLAYEDVEALSYEPETIVPPLFGDLNLAILQEMQRAGIVMSRKHQNKIEYSLAQ